AGEDGRDEGPRAGVARHWARLRRNQRLEANVRESTVELPLAGGHRLTVRDIRGGNARRPFGEEAFVGPGDGQGVLFVLEWAGADMAAHVEVIESALRLCDRHLRGLAVTKCERGLDADDPHWLAPEGWWREHPCFEPAASVMGHFGDRVWPTSAFGHDADGRPACLLNEFGQVMPSQINPRNVEVPFRWFFQELGLWSR